MKHISKVVLASTALTLAPLSAMADQVIIDDLIVDGSACIGFDCVNGESFGFDTLRLKENNLRIKAQDTSNSASFPSVDWQITFNDTSNGGANKFSIDDIDSGKTPFTIEHNAPSNALYVDDGGRIGLGTATPVVQLHVVDGNTPSLRLQQDGSSGFTPQTFDVAANEANFFVRDATNGSTLPFRVRPGAPSSSIDIAADGDVGIGTGSPSDALEIRRASGAVAIRLSSGAASAPNPLRLNFNTNQNEFRITYDGLGINQLRLNSAGNLLVNEALSVSETSTAPSAETDYAQIYVDPSDNGNLKVIFSDGTIKTLAVND